MIFMMNNTERKKVIIRDPYEDEDGRYLLSNDQIAVLHKMQADGYIDDEIEILVLEEEDPWELI